MKSPLTIFESSFAQIVPWRNVRLPQQEVFVQLSDCKSFTTKFINKEFKVPKELEALGLETLRDRRALGQRAVNSMNLSLSKIRIGKHGTVFTFQPVSYASTLGSHGSLEHVLPHGLTVREKYGDFAKRETVESFNSSVYSKMVGISALIVSSDNKALLTQRSFKVAVEPGSFHVTLPEGMSAEDVDDNGQISPVEAVLRGIREEIADPSGRQSLSVSAKDVKILGLGFSVKYLQPEFAALVRLPYSAETIVKGAEKSRGRWERKSILQYDFSAKTLLPLLVSRTWSPHGFYALYLAMKSEGLI